MSIIGLALSALVLIAATATAIMLIGTIIAVIIVTITLGYHGIR